MPRPAPKKYGPTREELIEQLAKIAVGLSGIAADGPMRLMAGDAVAYDGPAWRQPHILAKAAAALRVLS